MRKPKGRGQGRREGEGRGLENIERRRSNYGIINCYFFVSHNSLNTRFGSETKCN